MTIALFPAAFGLKEGGVPALSFEANLQKGRAAIGRATGRWGRLGTWEFCTEDEWEPQKVTLRLIYYSDKHKEPQKAGQHIIEFCYHLCDWGRQQTLLKCYIQQLGHIYSLVLV